MDKDCINSAELTPAQIDGLLAQLTKLGFRFTRTFTSRDSYSDLPPPERLFKAIVLDTETTGTDSVKDRIIELGMVKFEYSPETGQAYRVLETFNELEEPGIPITPESTKIHGITDEMVHGKHINDAAVQAFIADAPLIIAHNAKFDRVFVENRFSCFQTKAWACSFAQVPWADEGVGGAKLEFLAYRYGFHYKGHRASSDCHALLEVLQQNLPESGTKAMLRLIENARINEINVWALNSPYNSKDALRARGYRWNADRKSWSMCVVPELLESETKWLGKAVYGGQPFHLELEAISALNRFSMRRGAVENKRYS